MTSRQHQHLMSMNRVLIFGLTVSSLLLDGPQIADLLCTLALFVWLWLPQCTRIEGQLLGWIDGQHSRTNSRSALLP